MSRLKTTVTILLGAAAIISCAQGDRKLADDAQDKASSACFSDGGALEYCGCWTKVSRATLGDELFIKYAKVYSTPTGNGDEIDQLIDDLYDGMSQSETALVDSVPNLVENQCTMNKMR